MKFYIIIRMKEKLKKMRRRKRVAIFVAVALLFIALAITMTSIGKQVISPFEFSTTWDKPACAAYDENSNLGFVADRNAKRLSVLNSKHEIQNLNFVAETSMPIDNILEGCVYDNSLYLHGTKINDNSTGIDDEKIIRCSFMGEYKETIFSLNEIEQNLDNSVVHICDIKFYDNKPWITIRDGNTTKVFTLNSNSSEYPIYEEKSQATSEFTIFCSEYFPETNKFIVNNYINQYFEIDPANNSSTRVSNYNFDDDIDPEKIDEGTDYSLLFYIKILSRWASYLYISIVIILFLIWYFRTQQKNMKKGFIKKSALVLSIFLAVLGVSIIYNLTIYNAMTDTAANDLETMAEMSVNDISAQTIEQIKNLNDNKKSSSLEDDDLYRQETELSSKLSYLPDKIQKAATNTSNGVFYYVCSYDAETESWYPVASSNNNVLMLKYNSILNEEDIHSIVNNDSFSETDEDTIGKYIYSSKNFKDNNNVLGFYIFGRYTKSLDQTFYDNVGILTFMLIAAMLIIYALIRELENIGNQVSKYLKKKKLKNKLAYLQLIRPMSFFLSLSIGADAVLAVLISKELFSVSSFCEEITSMGLADLTISVPLVAAGLSLVIGIIVFSSLEKKFTSKAIFQVGSILLIASFIFMVAACMKESFLMFVVSKFFTGFFIGILRAELYSLAISEKSEEERHPLVSSIGRTGMPASVIAAVVCSWICIAIGNFSVYVFAAICIVLYFILGSFVIPKGVYFIKQENKKHDEKRNSSEYKKLGSRDILKWLFSPQIIVLIIFVIVPYTAAGGYRSYLFPLYSDGLGFDKSEISILYSLATAAAFIVVHPLSKFYNDIDNRNRIIIGLLLLGSVYVLFLFNSRIAWAVIVMALSLICQRVFGTSFRMAWVRHCEFHNLDRAQLQPVMYFIEEFLKAIQVVFFATFFVLGGNYACVIFGIFCIIGAIIFTIATHNSPIRRND